MLSNFLKERIEIAKSIVDELSKEYEYVSIFGKHAKGKRIVLNSKVTSIGESASLMETEAGFVIKVFNDSHYSEYSLDDIKDFDKDSFKQAIILEDLKQDYVKVDVIKDEKINKSFTRVDEYPLDEGEILERLAKFKTYFENYDKRIVNVFCGVINREVSSIFVSKNKVLDQYYVWNNVLTSLLSVDERGMKDLFKSTNDVSAKVALDQMEAKLEEIAKLSIQLLDATPIEVGVYDVICDPTISGLIAHEAFGHGVEMDMFVKNRAKAKDYINKQVASELVGMKDGAASALSAASYFFDDDGILAHDTTIIKNGILCNGISDILTASVLNKEPSGNSRRESTRRKAYTRMTNTFFTAGKDKVEDMFKSIKHGYYLCDTNNGMEDPKNWQIQCTAQYGLEIKDGEFTGKIVSPDVISGYVPDVLKSNSMVSDGVVITGAGMCGKGHKEWDHVSDGGPYLKAKVKLG